jgi:predicted enzyme related to lactoylglutathione lyase
VDDSVAAVEKAGGRTLVAPVNVSVGRAAVVSDPQGAPLGLLRLTGPDPVDETTPVEGTFFWMEYLARDTEAAAAFYTGTFGYQRRVTDRLGTTEYVVLSRGRPRGGILLTPKPEMRPTWLPYVLVADPAPLVAKVRAAGGTVLLEPRADIRNGSLAVVTDPSGAILALQKFPF